MFLDFGPWFVRILDTHIAVGVFTCCQEDLYYLVDEVCRPEDCEFTQLALGGLHFVNGIVLHDFDTEAENAGFMQVTLTEAMSERMYVDPKDWRLIDSPYAGEE